MELIDGDLRSHQPFGRAVSVPAGPRASTIAQGVTAHSNDKPALTSAGIVLETHADTRAGLVPPMAVEAMRGVVCANTGPPRESVILRCSDEARYERRLWASPDRECSLMAST